MPLRHSRKVAERDGSNFELVNNARHAGADTAEYTRARLSQCSGMTPEARPTVHTEAGVLGRSAYSYGLSSGVASGGLHRGLFRRKDT
jgi:hypothetical protein